MQLEQEEEEEEEEEEPVEEDAAATNNHQLREVVNQLKEQSATTIEDVGQEPEIMDTPYDTTGSAFPLPGSDEGTMRYVTVHDVDALVAT